MGIGGSPHRKLYSLYLSITLSFYSFFSFSLFLFLYKSTFLELLKLHDLLGRSAAAGKG
jgi:hypothetical protein